MDFLELPFPENPSVRRRAAEVVDYATGDAVVFSQALDPRVGICACARARVRACVRRATCACTSSVCVRACVGLIVCVVAILVRIRAIFLTEMAACVGGCMW